MNDVVIGGEIGAHWLVWLVVLEVSPCANAILI
jgi:hypothetical protein